MAISISRALNNNSIQQKNHFIKNERILKIQEVIKSSLKYFVEAIKVFAYDMYQSIFSVKIFTKIPFFIFVYGLATSLGAIETIYYIGLTILVLKITQDLVAYLRKHDKLKGILEYFPDDDKFNRMKSVLIGIAICPIVFFADNFVTQLFTLILAYFNISVPKEVKLIHQKGFIGDFASAYGILALPIIKEVFFRGYVQTYFTDDKNSSKFKTILKTALVFALIHFSPTSGFTNIPILLANITIGLIFSLLKDRTENLFASTTAHMLNNLMYTRLERRFLT